MDATGAVTQAASAGALAEIPRREETCSGSQTMRRTAGKETEGSKSVFKKTEVRSKTLTEEYPELPSLHTQAKQILSKTEAEGLLHSPGWRQHTENHRRHGGTALQGDSTTHTPRPGHWRLLGEDRVKGPAEDTSALGRRKSHGLNVSDKRRKKPALCHPARGSAGTLRIRSAGELERLHSAPARQRRSRAGSRCRASLPSQWTLGPSPHQLWMPRGSGTTSNVLIFTL